MNKITLLLCFGMLACEASSGDDLEVSQEASGSIANRCIVQNGLLTGDCITPVLKIIGTCAIIKQSSYCPVGVPGVAQTSTKFCGQFYDNSMPCL